MEGSIHQTQQISFAQELLRKSTHMGALIIPGSYYWLGLERGGMLMIMVPVTIVMILIDTSRLQRWTVWERWLSRLIGSMMRPHEQAGDFSGATYILVTVCLAVALFSKPIAVAALAFIIVGDTFAALIGRRWGYHRYGHKSWEGSLACLASLLIVALVTPDLPRSVGVLGAFVATVAEALPLGIDDNVTVPLLSGLVMTLALRLLA